MREPGNRTAVVLDRHPLWVEAMSRLLQETGVEVVAETTTSDQAVAAVEEFRPDILVAGLAGGGLEEVECIRRAKETYPELKSVVMAADEDPLAIESAFSAGASICCVKTAERADLASAIRQAFHRSIHVAGARQAAPAERPIVEPASPASDLTKRELEILRLVAEGHSNSQLARMLWVTEQTVKFHLSNIYRKLDVANRTEASRWAQIHGLLPTQRDGELASSAA
jgi:DNA-binding NarL/FixJ family response regulator